MEELETLLNKYTSEIEWEDLPLSVREYYLQQAHLEQVGDLCDKMEGVDLYEEQNHDWIADGMYLVEDEVVEGSDVRFRSSHFPLTPLKHKYIVTLYGGKCNQFSFKHPSPSSLARRRSGSKAGDAD